MNTPSFHLKSLLAMTVLSVSLTGIDACGNDTQYVTMRDGTNLATDVYTASRSASPSILMRTPYGKEGMQGYAPYLTDQGYNMVVQDMRGFGESEGSFLLFTDDGWGVHQDGYDTLGWVAGQDWANDDVCMWGASALGISALLAAGSTPPNLRCIYALAATGDEYHHIGFWGGALRNELAVNWLLGLEEYTSLEALYAHPTYDDFYQPVSIQERYDQITVPVYSVGGWYDIFSQGNLDIFSGADTGGGPGALGNQKLLMGPWTHGSTGPVVGELTYPENSGMPAGEDLRWFARWLKGEDNGVDSEPPVRYYLMGDVDVPSTQWNVWLASEVWPVLSTPTPWYFHPGGLLTQSPPQGETGQEESFVFDPLNPVPTLGGNNLTLPAGPYDQRSIEERSDVLLFSSDVLASPVALTGRVTASLWVSSSALDTDFTVKLTDVYPDGRSMLVLDGIVRMRFREGVDREVLMIPGNIYPVTVDLWSTALVLNAGHRIRIAISSSNAPRFHVNPNTGDTLYVEDTPGVVAEQTLYASQKYPAHVTLPIVALP